jgi:succinyl-diaminopimelate desuccinylase
MDRDKYTAVAACIDGYRDEVIRLQTEMCKRPALGPESGGEGEVEKAAWLESYLSGLGFSVDRYDAPDPRVPCGFRPNLVAVLPGEVAAPRLWLLAHTDVVPPGDPGLWTGDPWVVRVEGDRVIGRGVEDNQAGLVSALLTLKAFREAGLAPRLSIGVALVADEETANTYGLKFLLREHKHLFGKDDWIIVPDSGNPKGTAVEVAEKSILWMRFRVKGKQAHGSEPNRGINAHKAAAHLTTRLDTLYARFRKRDAVFEPPMSTFEPTKREANVPNINTIPGEDVFYFDCRVLPDYRLADVLRAVRALVRETEKKFRVKVEMTTPQQEEAAPPTPSDAPVARAVARAVRQLRRRSAKAIGIGGGTVAKYLREAGFPCVVWSTMDERAHTPDEYAIVSYILDDAKVFAHVALQGPRS